MVTEVGGRAGGGRRVGRLRSKLASDDELNSNIAWEERGDEDERSAIDIDLKSCRAAPWDGPDGAFSGDIASGTSDAC